MQDMTESARTGEVLAANQAFYDAFVAGSHDVMATLWARNSEVSVMHPGSAVIQGRGEVLESWRQILQAGQENHMKCKSPRAYLHDDFAYVTCIEAFPEGELIATNIFVCESGEWRMVHHQAGPITPSSDPDGERVLH